MKSLYYRLAAAILVFIGGVSTLLAETKLYIEDFSITAGETKTVAVCLNTDVADLQTVSMTISLPEGLEFVTKDFGNGKQVIDVTINTSRAAGFNAVGNPETGKISITALGSGKITAADGELFSIKLTAGNTLAPTSTIELKDAEAKSTSQGNVNVTVGNATVTISSATPEQVAVSFSQTETSILAGATGNVDVNMTNTGVNVSGFQADVVLPEGWSSTVTVGRLAYNGGDNTRIMFADFSTPIPGEEGALFTLTLTAPADFTGETVVKLTNIYVTIGFDEQQLDDITLTVSEAGSDFAAYKTEKAAEAEAMAQDTDSEASQQLIANAKAAIEALAYDDTKTLDENKAAVDAIIEKLKEDLAAQRTQDTATTVEAISAKYDKNTVVYTIDGRRVNAASQIIKGIYIVNGKKVIVK